MQKQAACNQEAIGYSQDHLLVARQIDHRLRFAFVHARFGIKGIIAARAVGISELSPTHVKSATSTLQPVLRHV